MQNNQQQQKNYRVIGYSDRMSYDAWLALRSNSIGGSEIAAAMGLNPYCTRFECWARKTGHVKSKVEQNEAMYWGNRLQHIIADEFEKRHAEDNYKVIETKAIFQHKTLDHLTANIDGYVDMGNGEFAVLEIKTTAAWNAEQWNDNLPGKAAEVPISYYLQCQYYMMLLNGYNGKCTPGKIRKAFLVCLVGGNAYKEVEIPYDEEIAAVILYKANEFWELVKNNIPPDVTSKDNKLLAEVFPSSNANTVQLADEFSNQLEQLASIKTQEAALKAIRDEIESKIRMALGENGSATCGGWNISYKSSIRNTFDSDAAKKLLTAEELQTCMKQTSTRTLRITKAKIKTAKAK